MTIAFFDDRYPMVYGAQENLLLLAVGCRDSGRDVVFVTTGEGKLAQEARRRGLCTEVIAAPDRLLQFGGVRAVVRTGVDTLRYGRRLSRRLVELDAEAVVASAVRPSMMLMPLRLRWTRRVPVVLWAQNSTPLGVYAVIAALAARRIALIAPGARTTFPESVLRRARSKLRALPSGRDFARLSAVARRRSDRPRSDHPVVLCVAAIEQRKGLSELVSAAAAAAQQIGPIVVRIVGSADDEGRLAYARAIQHQADDAGVQLVLEGWRDDVVPFYEDADLFVLASRDEGLPGALLEAAAAGLPCITTRAGSAGDLVEECGAGRAVDVGDIDALSSAMVALLTNAEEWRDASMSGRTSVTGRYGIDAMMRAFTSILDELIGSERR